MVLTRLYADTQDEDILYVLNVRYHKSTDGGKTYKTFNAPHGDHHDLWIAPEDNQRMIIGDDGGAQVSFELVLIGVPIKINQLHSFTELPQTIIFPTVFMELNKIILLLELPKNTGQVYR